MWQPTPGELADAASAVLRVQVTVPVSHVHPVPLSPVAVKPVGSVSFMVIDPTVGPAPLFVTVIVYVLPVSPWVKLPVWLLETVRSGERQVLKRMETLFAPVFATARSGFPSPLKSPIATDAAPVPVA